MASAPCGGSMRVQAYLLLLVDDYSPFSLE